MKEFPRLVLDTNVFISAFVLRKKVYRIAEAWFRGRFIWLISSAIENEYLDVLPRPKFHEAIHTAVYGFILLTALWGLYLRRRQLFKRDVILQFITLGFVLVYSLYFPSTRLRAPMDFVLMFYSAFALNRWTPRPA